MRKTLLLALFLGAGFLGKTQQYVSITMDPPAPNDTDPITFYVEMMFPSSGCEGTTNATAMGSTITGSSNYCMGMLSAICMNTDTLSYGPMPAGNYTLNLTLSAGYGLPSCSPPFVPNDDTTFAFTVSTTLGTHDFANAQKLEVFPNPAKGFVNINWKGSLANPLKVNLVDGTGRLVATENLTGNALTLKAEPGVYFIQIPEKGICKKLIME